MVADLAVLSDSQVVSALGMTLLDFLWQGALLAAAYALAITLFKSSRWARLRLSIGHLTLLGFALAPVFTLGNRLSALSPLPSVSLADSSVSVLAVAGSPGVASLESPAHAFLPWLVGIWLLCVLALAARGLLRWRTIRQVCLSAAPLSGEWRLRVTQLHARLGVRIRVRVLQSVQVATPILVGWLRPTILLPVGLCTRLTVQQVELILAHELAHVRRLDAWANALQSALETILFYHPAVHWVGRRIRNDREMACDQWVAQGGIDRFEYARALLALAEEQRRQSLTGLALAATGGVLLARIEAVLQAPSVDGRRYRLEGQLPAAVLGALIAVMTLMLGTTNRTDDASGLIPLAASQVSIARLTPTLELLINDLKPSLTSMPARWATDEERPVPASALPHSAASVGGGDAILDRLPLPRMNIERSTTALDADMALGLAAALPETLIERVELAATESDSLSLIEMPADNVAPPRPLLQTQPDYPRAARLRGVEGSVLLSFALSASGEPTDIEVVFATQKAFANAAIDSLNAWRFPPSVGDGTRHQQAFDFMLSGPAAQDDCRPLTGTRLCRSAEESSATVVTAESRGVRIATRRGGVTGLQ